MGRNKQRGIASKGGKDAHQKGTAHEWTSEEARHAERKGGRASHRRKQGQQQPASQQAVASEGLPNPYGGGVDERRDAALENPRDRGDHGPVRDEPNY